jgi:Mat/Ecp fimbriae outer membrane usher protein
VAPPRTVAWSSAQAQIVEQGIGHQRKRISRGPGDVARAVLLLLVFCSSWPLLAQETPPTSEEVSEPDAALQARAEEVAASVAVPAGFEDLLEPALTYVDVYFGGRPIGSTTAVYGPGFFQFEEPFEIITRLGELRDPDPVLSAMQAPMDPNENEVCYGNQDEGCGLIHPASAGVIYNPDTFRADLFINPEYLSVAGRSLDPYLPQAPDTLSFTSGVTGAFSGSSGESATYSGQNESVLGFGDARAISNLVYQTTDGLYLDGLRGEKDMMDWRYTGGLFDALGGKFIGDELVWGASVGTMTDRRLDLATAIGSEVILFLPQRSQVEILREGRLISSEFYPAGNNVLDTSNLPDGSYEITLRTTQINGTVTEETRFYTKSQRLPPLGAPLYLLEFGFLATQFDSQGERENIPGPETNQPVVHFETVRRIYSDFGLYGSAIGNPNVSLVEGGGIYVGTGYQLEATAMWSTDNDWGLQGTLSGSYDDWTGSFQVRRVWPGKEDIANIFEGVVYDPIGRNQFQATGTLTRRFDAFSVALLGS